MPIGNTIAMVAVAIAIAVSPVVTAAGAEDNCDNAQTQTDMNICFGRAADKAEDELNRTYQTLLKKVEAAKATDGADSTLGQAITRLRAAEKAWVTYRERECSFETWASEGGSVHPMEVTNCMANLARERTKVLRRQMNCKEGDLSCIVHN